MLKVWIPGTTDTRDQGLGGVTWTNSGVTIDSSGKLGKCLYSGTSGNMTTSNFSLSAKWSYSCWWKDANTSAGWQYIFLLHNGTQNDTNSQMAFLSYPTQSRCEVCSNGKWYSVQAYTPGTWNHIAATYDGTTCKVYFNGIYTTSFTPRQTVTGTNLQIFKGANVYLNDLRIWDDEVISAKEIEIISRGLVLHYPLAMPGGENLLKNSLTNFPELWSGSGDGRTLTTQSGVSVPEWGCTDGLRVYGKSGASSALCLLINDSTHGLTVPSASVSGQKYTPSIYIKNNHQNAIYIAFNGLGTGQIIHQGEIKKVILNASGNGKSYLQFTISASGANKEYDFTFWHPKIELGEVCTPWVPATTDSLYSTMGFNDGIEYDVSGYQHNGTKTGTFTYDVSTPRYNTSTRFNQTDTRITPPIIFQSGAKIPEISFSFWMKRNDYTDAKNHYIYNDICQIYTYSDYLLRISWKHDTESSSTGNISASSSAITTPNEWHHICYTFDKGILRLYIDGEFKYGSDRTDTGQFMGVYNYGSIGYASGSNISYGGCLSDFRIYATVLTFDQIKDLYHTPISLSNNGALLTQGEYVES